MATVLVVVQSEANCQFACKLTEIFRMDVLGLTKESWCVDLEGAIMENARVQDQGAEKGVTLQTSPEGLDATPTEFSMRAILHPPSRLILQAVFDFAAVPSFQLRGHHPT